VLGPTWHGLFKSIYFFDPNGHRLELACDIGTGAARGKREVAPAMLEEWSQTKRAPRHAAWLHKDPPWRIRRRDRPYPRSARAKLGARRDGHADFPVQNLPLGVFSHGNAAPRIGTAIGDWVLDLAALDLGPALRETTLNALFACPWRAARAAPRGVRAADRAALPPKRRCTCMARMRAALALRIGDYTDFYVGIHHATTIGKLFRPDNPLLPNYKHVPIGYHGRASSVRVSGTPVRGHGPDCARRRRAHPCAVPRLDHELELGLWMAGDNDLGQPVPIARWSRIGGLCLLNDWSARDIQAWEYQPLGPFLAKNFLTTVSPWVITAQALAPFRTAPAAPGWRSRAHALSGRNGAGGAGHHAGATILTPAMREAGLPPHRLSHGNAHEAMYWTAAQIVAHHASNGCDLHAGDLLGTGTLSGHGRKARAA
jgi:fumarylacetoacetase